jgi:uncharacterized protein (UPF0248 family)
MNQFDKELLEKDVLYRILWDGNLKSEDYSIMYLDSGVLKQVPFSEIKLEGDFFSVGDALIPMHRIRRILCRGAVVWEKRRI